MNSRNGSSQKGLEPVAIESTFGHGAANFITKPIKLRLLDKDDFLQFLTRHGKYRQAIADSEEQESHGKILRLISTS